MILHHNVNIYELYINYNSGFVSIALIRNNWPKEKRRQDKLHLKFILILIYNLCITLSQHAVATFSLTIVIASPS